MKASVSLSAVRKSKTNVYEELFSTSLELTS